jgi:asparagine synthetase B (glutamine-hydrolysing)
MEKRIIFNGLELRHSLARFEIRLEPFKKKIKWRDAYVERCREVLNLGLPVNIFYSGGLDSEIASLCFQEAGAKNLQHTFFALMLNGKMVNAYEFGYCERFVRRHQLRLEVLKYDLEELLSSRSLLEDARAYGIPHFEWLWQVHFIRENPFARSHFNVCCAGDLNTDANAWNFNPMWTFHERLREETDTAGCLLFPLSSSALVWSWITDEERIAAASDAQSVTEARDRILLKWFTELEPRKKLFAHKQMQDADNLVTRYNKRNFPDAVHKHVFQIPLAKIVEAQSSGFEYGTDTEYRL